MKKIPTLFERVFENHKVVGIRDSITPGCEEAFLHGVATVKHDGSCCAIIDGDLYKRYDAKKGKTPPEGAIPCCDPDPVTGHWPHWVKVDLEAPGDKWFREAFENAGDLTCAHARHVYGVDLRDRLTDDLAAAACGLINKDRIRWVLSDGTYEAVGPHFQGNPYRLTKDTLYEHGDTVENVERTFEGVKKYLEEHYIEGLVFWLNGNPVCKIKRSDFGFEWNGK